MTSVSDGTESPVRRELPDLPEPLPAGEAFADYYQRAILDDQEFAASARSARRFGFDVAARGSFGPAFFTFRLATAVADGVAALPIGESIDPDRHRRVVDHLWQAQSLTLPLDIRMLPHLLAGGRDVPSSSAHEELIRRLSIWHRAASRRDFLVTALCEKLRNGEFACQAFFAGDPLRREAPVPAAWWSDRTFRVAPTKGESLTNSDGTPAFRGMTVAAVSRQAAVSPTPLQPKKLARLPTIARGAVSKWFREVYIPANVRAGLIPTRDEELAAAIAAFPHHHVPRDYVRELHALPETPKPKKGRPKKA
jgi:hypothetical protein